MPRKVVDMSSEEIVDEKKVLKEAEKREKERKVEEEKEKEEQKIVEKEEKVKAKKGKVATVRKKFSHGKKYREILKTIDKSKQYPASEAIDLVLTTNTTKFDATVELHIRVKKSEKNIRGMVKLPGGLAKERKILEVTDKNIEDVITMIKSGKTDFDILIADLKVMPKMAQLAKTLGPKGLMPSPKAGTAVEDVQKAVEDLKGGKIEYRADKDSNVHIAVGKISFGAEKIHQNCEAVLGAIPKKKIDSLHLTTTMGPSVRVAIK